jgi:hypothetical protein
METWEAVMQAVSQWGVTAVVLAYFIFRDYKFMGTLQTTLQTLVDSVNLLKELIKSN